MLKSKWLLKNGLIPMVALAISALPAIAGSITEIQRFRLSETPERTRLVFDLSGAAQHKLFTLSKPERVVIDIEDVRLSADLPRELPETDLVRQLRNAPRNGDDLRVVLDLRGRARTKSFLLAPDSSSGHRLVIDLFADKKAARKVTKTLPQPQHLRDVIIAIDAGHGGKDPGAIGRHGTYEKHIALSVARELARQVKKQRGMKPVLIRDGDYYIGLRDRMEKAREHKADLFISIHADAFKNKSARGSSVYALSLNGATSEAAKWLAGRENASELVGGVTLDDKDDMVASVLLDLSQTATIQASLDVGRHVLAQLSANGRLHKPTVQQAGFIVLKSPDIPSILVETAFISNPEEERKLTNKKHQKKMASSLLKGIKKYFQHKAPPGTLLAEENRKQRYGNKVSALWR